MELAELRKLISEGESDRLEFKRSTAELRSGMETVCGFLNEHGRRVLFGVANSGRIPGQQIADSTLQDVANALQRMPSAEYERRLLARLQSQQRWENRVAEGYTLRDLDTAEIRRTLEAAVDAGRLETVVTNPQEALDRLGLRVDGQLVQAAIVAFGRRLLPDYPQCSVRMARFRGTTKTEVLDQRQMEGHAFLLLREAENIPPHRVSHDLTERPREILQVLADGERYAFREVYEISTAYPCINRS